MTHENDEPKVYIVILNWNNFEDTERCLRSLHDQKYNNYKIVVIDNGSADDSASKIKDICESTDAIDLIKLPENIGYTGGNNVGIKYSLEQGAEYVWLFNNDAVAEPNMLKYLIESFKDDSRLGVVSPIVKDIGTNNVQFALGVFDLNTPTYTPVYSEDLADKYIINGETNIAIVGTAMLVKRSVFDQIGVLDDEIFAYWEDIEFSIRSVSAKFVNKVINTTSLLHPPKKTIDSPETVKPHYYYFMARNELIMWRKHCSQMAYIRSIYWAFHRQIKQIDRMPNYRAGKIAIFDGLWDGIIGRGGRYEPAYYRPRKIIEIILRITHKISV
ncbi:MAG: glycosyltransferase family 2 protein [Acidiphilium sp.]|nr:glycosyltransferase family 2 protein [Acidiphilium sp.]